MNMFSFVIVVMRSIYKDFVLLLQDDRLLVSRELRKKVQRTVPALRSFQIALLTGESASCELRPVAIISFIS